jgi:hypothetical protein
MNSNSKKSRVILALQALENDPCLTARRSAKIYSALYSTVLDRRSGRPSRRDIQPNSRMLTDLEESVIVQYVLDLDSKGFPPRLCGVEDIANRLLAERNTRRVGTR